MRSEKWAAVEKAVKLRFAAQLGVAAGVMTVVDSGDLLEILDAYLATQAAGAAIWTVEGSDEQQDESTVG